jgi:hypothetical protein
MRDFARAWGFDLVNVKIESVNRRSFFGFIHTAHGDIRLEHDGLPNRLKRRRVGLTTGRDYVAI